MKEMEIDVAKQQALDILKAQYEMSANTLRETQKRLEDQLREDGTKMFTKTQIESRLSAIKENINDTLQQYVSLGGNPDDLTSMKKKKGGVRKYETPKASSVKSEKKEEAKTENNKEIKKNMTKSKTYIPKKRDFGNSVAFDVIPLPSKGEVYKEKTDRLQVAYLTANDENMFVSPNLYRDGLLIDFLLNEKILEEGVDCGNLLDGDRDAIVLWLRATGYGNEFPISVTDSKTGTEFEAVVDLADIKFKEFNLKGDENGWFDYELPMTKDIVKFKFLSHREVEELKKNELNELPGSVKNKLNTIAGDIRTFLDKDEILNKAQKSKLYESCREIEDWSEEIEEDGGIILNTVTNRLEAQIMSVNGNTNRGYISDYIRNMNTRDSMSLRKYMNDNEPGLDFNVEIDRPKSLGGGSQTVFLSIDQFIFLNIA